MLTQDGGPGHRKHGCRARQALSATQAGEFLEQSPQPPQEDSVDDASTDDGGLPFVHLEVEVNFN
jgi:hypothetical protein